MTDLKVEGTIWEMKDGKTTAIMVDEEVYRISTPRNPPSPYVHHVKKPYLYKWIKDNNIKEFTLERFYKAYPKQRERAKNVNSHIAKLIAEDKIMQMGKDKFVVKKKLEEDE